MSAVGDMSDTEEIITAQWSIVQHNGVAAFKLWETSPLPLALSEKDLCEGWTKVLNVRQMKRIDCHPAESDEDGAPESILNTDNCLDYNDVMHNPNWREDDGEADDECDEVQDNGIEDPDGPDQWDGGHNQMFPEWFGQSWA